MRLTTKLLIGLGVLAIATPIGLYLPNTFKAGSGWGEWTTGELGYLAGYVPRGLAKLSSLWHAPFPGYAPGGSGHLSAAYIFSAILGLALCLGCGILLGKLLLRKKNTVGKEH